MKTISYFFIAIIFLTIGIFVGQGRIMPIYSEIVVTSTHTTYPLEAFYYINSINASDIKVQLNLGEEISYEVTPFNKGSYRISVYPESLELISDKDRSKLISFIEEKMNGFIK